METNINITTGTVKRVLPTIYGSLTTKKIIILIEAANKIDGQVFSGVITEDGTLYGNGEMGIIKWSEFLDMKVQIGDLSITPNS